VADPGLAPEACLAITFTRRAADEMRERLVELLPGRGDRVPVMTIHALGLQILRRHPRQAGLRPGFSIASDDERLALLRDELGLSERKARGLLKAASLAKRTGRAPEADADLESFERLMRERNQVDFDDLVVKAADTLQSDPGLIREYQQRYGSISIDEFQDTDAQQVRLIKLLAGPEPDLCAIGDPDQSIYGFRGADPEVFARFESDFPGARVIRLKRNYRSGSSIVDGALQVISRADGLERKLRSMLEHPERIGIHEAPTDRAEAEFVVQYIEKMIGGHTFFSIDSGRSTDGRIADLSFSDFAVLYRTDAQAEPLVEALERSGIPFEKRSHDRLVDSLDAWDERADRGSLLTLHAAKGLEFAVVFLVGCSDGVLPLRWGRTEAADREEERRLFYVGMTRARRKLMLCWARKRRWRGRVREMEPSPFLLDIEQKLTENLKTRLPTRRRGGADQLGLF